MHCNRNTTCSGNLVSLLWLKCCDVGQECCFPLGGEQESMPSLDVPIFSLNASVLQKDPRASAKHKLLFPSQWETTYKVITVLQT